jgi:hypothetical protein
MVVAVAAAAELAAATAAMVVFYYGIRRQINGFKRISCCFKRYRY